MRIISGIAKGRRLQVPATNEVRPTTDRVREALFSHLGNRLPGSMVLDLFAGSGALGLESLSRGAASVVFVEKSRPVYGCLEKNVGSLGFEEQCSCNFGDALKWLKSPTIRSQQFDLIFLDPPYDSVLLQLSLNEIAECRCLSPHGMIVTEQRAEPGVTQLEIPREFQIVRTKQYGKTAVTTLVWTLLPEKEQSN